MWLKFKSFDYGTEKGLGETQNSFEDEFGREKFQGESNTLKIEKNASLKLGKNGKS